MVTDAAGASLDDRLLLGSGPAFQMSVIIAGNRLLHSRLVDAIDEGVERLRRSMAS